MRNTFGRWLTLAIAVLGANFALANSVEHSTRLKVSVEDGKLDIETRYFTYYIAHYKTSDSSKTGWAIVQPNEKLVDVANAIGKEVDAGSMWPRNGFAALFTSDEMFGRETTSIELNGLLGEEAWKNSEYRLQGGNVVGNLTGQGTEQVGEALGIFSLNLLRGLEIFGKIATGSQKASPSAAKLIPFYEELGALSEWMEQPAAWIKDAAFISQLFLDARQALSDFADAVDDPVLKDKILNDRFIGSPAAAHFERMQLILSQSASALGVGLTLNQAEKNLLNLEKNRITLETYDRLMATDTTFIQIGIARPDQYASDGAVAMENLRKVIRSHKASLYKNAKTDQERQLILASYALDLVGKISNRYADNLISEYKKLSGQSGEARITLGKTVFFSEQLQSNDDIKERLDSLRIRIVALKSAEMLPDLVRFFVHGHQLIGTEAEWKTGDYVLPFVKTLGSVVADLVFNPTYGMLANADFSALFPNIAFDFGALGKSFAAGAKGLSVGATIGNQAIPFVWDLFLAQNQFEGNIKAGQLLPYGEPKYEIQLLGNGEVSGGSPRVSGTPVTITHEQIMQGSSTAPVYVLLDSDKAMPTVQFKVTQPLMFDEKRSPWMIDSTFPPSQLYGWDLRTESASKVGMICARNQLFGGEEYALHLRNAGPDAPFQLESPDSVLTAPCGSPLSLGDLTARNRWFDGAVSSLPDPYRLRQSATPLVAMQLTNADKTLVIDFQNLVDTRKLYRKLVFVPKLQAVTLAPQYQFSAGTGYNTTLQINAGLGSLDRISSLLINWGDGTPTSAAGTQHTYAAAGQYTVQVSFQTASGQTASHTQTITIGAAPSATLSPSNNAPSVGSPVVFSLAAMPVQPASYIASLVFTPGDGSDATERTWRGGVIDLSDITHTYAREGQFVAEMSVTDNLGVSRNLAQTINVRAASAATGKLPHTGITASQCYAAGSNGLVACSSPGATSLNSQQDGHRAGINAMSYGKLGFNGEPLADNASSWCAVKDKVTGLVWQNHQSTPAGYTNYGDNRPGDASKYAADNATLCGLSGWRLPTVDELQTIVDYGRTGPAIDTTWFPNTPVSGYWSSSPNVGNTNRAWRVGFNDSNVLYFSRSVDFRVRLVRASQ